MVVIVYKKSEKNAFSVICSMFTKVGTLLNQLVQINNLRVYLDRLIWSVEELANKGALKPLELQGVSWEDFEKHQKEFQHLREEALAYGRKPIVQPPYRFVSDKHNQRFGVILSSESQKLLLDAVSKGRKVLQFLPEVIASKEGILQTIESIRQAVMQAYPGYIELPEWQPTVLMLQENIDLQVLETENFEVFDERASLWWAGKQLQKDKAVGQYVGKNQKSKIIVKVQKWGGQQPLRQPPIDAQTYQKMVKFYYKKVQQTKESEKHSVQSHYQQIETKSMKKQFHMPEQIRYKPF